MPTAKVKRADGYHCLHCNAQVDEAAERCPGCGRKFGPGQPSGNRGSEMGLVERMRWEARAQRRFSYWGVVLVLGVVGLAVMLLSRPWIRREHPTLPEPGGARPEFRVLQTIDMPGEGLDRVTVVGLVKPGLSRDSLKAVLDWLLYETLRECNVQRRRFVRVVWAYVLDDSTAPKSHWRAMAVWVDPKLPESHWPPAARIGDDAQKEWTIEYDFTNPVLKEREE
ncbi:MAG: hypothetical protein ABIK44_03375 [candidate division WOR-3 bacterium]